MTSLAKLGAHLVQGVRSRFVRDSGNLATGVFVAQLIGLAISPILTRLYSPSDFGVFASVMAVSTMVAVFSTLRLETIIPVVHGSNDALRLLHLMVGVSCVTGVIALMVVLALDDLLGALLSLPPGGKTALLVLPLLIALFAVYSGVRAWCIRLGRFTTIGKAQVVRGVVAALAWLGLGYGGVLNAPGVALATGQACADFAFSASLLRSLTRREWRLLLTPRWIETAVVLRRNSQMVRALVFSQAIAAFYGRLPIVVIAAVYGPAAAGFYALAEMVVSAPATLLSSTIGDVYRQRAANAHRARKPFDGLMRQVLGLTLVLSVVPFAITILLTPHYLGVIFGTQWQPADFTMMLLLFGALVAFNSTPVDKAAIIVGANRYIMLWHVLRLVIEGLAAVLAMMGALSYEFYLVAIVAGRCALYLWDIAVEHNLAKGRR